MGGKIHGGREMVQVGRVPTWEKKQEKWMRDQGEKRRGSNRKEQEMEAVAIMRQKTSLHGILY